MKRNPVSLIAVLFILSCSKKNDTNNVVNTIDVSAQWRTDPSGILLSGSGDGQWQAKSFNSAELNLFAALDTADLSGTTLPAAVQEIPSNYNCIFPNPFTGQFAMIFHFTPGYSGRFVFKYVITDSLLNIIVRKAIPLQATLNAGTSMVSFYMQTNVPAGRYRLYFTLSAASSPHFYKSWGNIQSE